MDPQGLHLIGLVDGAGEQDLGRGGRLDRAMIAVVDAHGAEDHEPDTAVPTRERLDERQDVVVGLDAGDRHEIAAGVQPQRRRADLGGRWVAAVRDGHDRPPRAPGGQMIGDGRMVGDEPVRGPRGDPFAQVEIGPDRERPFRAAPFDPVHVGQDPGAADTQERQEGRTVVAEHEADAAASSRVAGTDGVERQGRGGALQRDFHGDLFDAVPDLRRDPRADPVDLPLAIHPDAPAPDGQITGEALRKSLEPAMSGRNSARS